MGKKVFLDNPDFTNSSVSSGADFTGARGFSASNVLSDWTCRILSNLFFSAFGRRKSEIKDINFCRMDRLVWPFRSSWIDSTDFKPFAKIHILKAVRNPRSGLVNLSFTFYCAFVNRFFSGLYFLYFNFFIHFGVIQGHLGFSSLFTDLKKSIFILYSRIIISQTPMMATCRKFC